MEEQIKSLTNRLEHLEGSRRRWRLGAVIAAFVMVLAKLGVAPVEGGETKSRVIELVSDDGRRSIRISPDAITLYDSGGVRATLSMDSTGTAGLALFARPGTADLSFYTAPTHDVRNRSIPPSKIHNWNAVAHILLMAGPREDGCSDDFASIDLVGGGTPTGQYVCGKETKQREAPSPTSRFFASVDTVAQVQVLRSSGDRAVMTAAGVTTDRKSAPTPAPPTSPSPPSPSTSTATSPVKPSAVSQCGMGCPAGYHPTRYFSDRACGAGGNLNKSDCALDAAFFGMCGTACPTNYRITARKTSPNCGAGGNNNYVDCAAN